MDGDTIIAKILRAEGVEWMTCYPYQTLIEAGAKEGIRPIVCRQERAGVNMADGFSRISNGKRVGVFTMQRGPGAENAFGGVAQAFADSVPLLLFPGGEPAGRQGVPPTFGATRNYEGITKWSAHVNMVERIPEMLSRAFTNLRHGRRGPVLLEVPQDVASAEFPGDTFHYTPVTERKSAADPDDVRDLVKALLAASDPVINAGQGVLYAEATDELVEFAELTGIPVMTTLAGKSAYPENHPLSLGTGSHSATLMVDHFLKKTDFVLGMGTSFTISNFNAPMPSGVTLAHSTNCPEDLNKDYRVAYGAIGDSKLVLKQMIEEAKRQTDGNGRSAAGVADEISKVRETFMAEWGPNFTSDEVPISPYRVFHEIAKELGSSNVIITHDSGYPREQLVPFWQSTQPRGYLGWGKSTQLGYGLGLSMGAKLAAPDKHVVNVMGDAAFGMAGMDIETAARAEIGTLTVILNNSVMTYYSNHMPYASEQWGANRFSGEYAKVAEGLGAYAEKVHTPDRIASALRNGVEATKKGQPAVLEIITKEETNVPKFW